MFKTNNTRNKIIPNNLFLCVTVQCSTTRPQTDRGTNECKLVSKLFIKLVRLTYNLNNKT